MHVLLEGVFPLHLEHLLQYIIRDASILNLSQINSRILDFPYAYFETKPSALASLDVQGTQSGMHAVDKFNVQFENTHHFLAASQMWELMNILPFVIGKDMPQNDPHLECFMLLSTISSILFSTIIARDQVPYLRLLIKEYLEQFTFLYPHRPLTPKMHYLTHLPTLVER